MICAHDREHAECPTCRSGCSCTTCRVVAERAARHAARAAEAWRWPCPLMRGGVISGQHDVPVCICGAVRPVCPCEGEVDDPGPHIASCRFSDPNYLDDAGEVRVGADELLEMIDGVGDT